MASSEAVVLIAGANQGIGYSIALQLAASGKYHVLVGARSATKAEAVTDAFLPLVQGSSYTDRRIVNVSSGVGLITMANEQGYEYNAQAYYVPDYRSSKAAVNMITVAQSVNFAKHNIAVVAAAPGMCRTRLTGGHGVKDPSEGAAAIVRAATEGDPKKLTGTFVADEPHTGW
ncbi:short-chain dehydrogenase [Fusarium bulbicola]|nr:short-chain dehydrogenase [Fusarium bulbicola]